MASAGTEEVLKLASRVSNVSMMNIPRVVQVTEEEVMLEVRNQFEAEGSKKG